VHRLASIPVQLAQRARFLCADRMIRGRAVLGPRYAQHGLLEVDLIPAQRDELSGAQTVPIRDQNQCRIAMAMAAHSRSGAYELLDLVGRQILAGPNGPIRSSFRRQFPQSTRH